MRVRRGVVRGLIAALAVLLLVVPVGIEGPSGPSPAPVGEALGELASGRLGVGILSALVAGGELAGAAVWRIVLAAMAIVAFWLAGAVHFGRGESEPSPKRRRRCPQCGAWASADMLECPGCGRTIWERVG